MLYSSGSTRVIYLLSFLTCEIECVHVINIISKGKGNNETIYIYIYTHTHIYVYFLLSLLPAAGA